MKNEERIVAIIPARGGSKGLPRKNIMPLGKVPLIAHSIQQAINATLIDRTIVSTDDQEIKAISQKHGAEVIMRPEKLGSDTASSESVLLQVLDCLWTRETYRPDIVVFLQCTSPLRSDTDIDGAISHILHTGADSLLSVSPTHRFLWEVHEGIPRSINYDYRHRKRRQDIGPQYVENGSIYIFKPWVLRELNNRLGGKIELYVMSPESSWEIDTSCDFAVVEALYRIQEGLL